MTLIEEIELRLNRLPPEKQSEVLDFVTFLQEHTHVTPPVSAQIERGKRIKAAFLKLVELKVFADIKNPVEWQRQVRKDRPLPGRST